MSELTVLQAVRLKGRAGPEHLAATLDEDVADVATTVERLIASDLLVSGTTLQISPAGRTRLNELLAEERKRVDQGVLDAAYDDFRAVNTDFKALVLDWQVKDGKPNTHQDSDYDARVLAGIDDVHRRATAVIAAAASQLPRLSRYATKLQAALDKVKAGDIAWLTRPLIDSYHTVWFELHEELILAAGLTRETEANAGYAQ